MSRRVRWLIFAIVGLSAIVWLTATQTHQRWLQWWVERTVNAQTQELFGGSVRFDRVHLNRRLRLRIEGIEAQWHIAADSVPLHIDRMESRGPITDIALRRPWSVRFSGAKIGHPSRPGLRGLIRVQQGPRWRLALDADVELMELSELVWINSQHLRGSTGELTGTVRMTFGAQQTPELDCALRIDEPGGLVQTKMFEWLVPYLPATEAIRRLAARNELIEYRRAALELHGARDGRLKGLFRIDVPSHHLIVNLNLEITVDDETAIQRWLRLPEILNY